MKKTQLIFFILGIFLLFGCHGSATPVHTQAGDYHIIPTTQSFTSIPTRLSTNTPTISPPTASRISTETSSSASTRTAIPTITALPTRVIRLTISPTIPPEARLNFQCLNVEPSLVHDAASSGIVVLESRVVVDGHYKSDSFLADMETGELSPISGQDEAMGNFIISPDRKVMAYEKFILDSNGKAIKQELVIAATDGKQQKAIPWEEKWLSMLGWLDNQRLIISYDDPTLKNDGKQKTPFAYLVLYPFNNERQVIIPDYPGFLDSTSVSFPYWDGWNGVIFDPTLKRAIFPRYIVDGSPQYTYALWDVQKHQLVATLENIFTPTADAMSPMPRWLPDGSQFVLKGIANTPDHPSYELFRVSRDGQTEQLTHLGNYKEIVGSSYSWSPDGRYIALFLYNWGEEISKVAVLDTKTQEITNYCFSVAFGGEGYGGTEWPHPPIWSPDGTQFLVMDWYAKDHRSVILVDIAQGFAAKIAEDMEPVGWMVKP